MSSRDGRPGERRSDWLIGKGHDGHAPLGPYIVPSEFIEDPMNLSQKLTVNGKLMQDARSTDMIHNVYELIEWGSSIITLESGDVIVATIEGIGQMTHKIKAHEEAHPGRVTSSGQQ